MGFFVERNGGLGNNGLIQEQKGADSPNAIHTSPPATMASEEDLKARIYDLQCQLNEKQEEIIKVKVQMSEEIQQLKSELHAMSILLNAKEEQARRSNRRSKLRVYLP
ncbi:MAG TPA: hypothetical protein VGJ48_18040 [Pyrinomonadaceae bacterium]|jgi:hypothetical protein